MFRKASIILLTVVFICFTSITSFAQEGDQVIKNSDSNLMQPYWTEISLFSNTFSISDSGLATVESLLYAFDVDEIRISAQLQQLKNGSWTTIKSWTSSSTDVYCTLAEVWYVMSGYSYRMVSTGTVYENNSQVEQTTYISDIWEY